MSIPKACMLGPKAENQDLLERMLVDAFRDYCYWRRNFHPEDHPHITEADRRDPTFLDFQDRLRDHLFQMLSRLKMSVPFFSPRYLGHMLTDLLIPGIVGYFSAMLYNQNNIYGEAGNITMPLEAEALQCVAAMLRLPEETCWGHLCSGGTAANIEALWVARNVRLLPFQLALAVKRGTPAVADKLSSLPIGAARTFKDLLEAGELQCMNLQSILALSAAVTKECGQDRVLAAAVESQSLGHLGLAGFVQACRHELGPRFPTSIRVFVGRTAHYSIRKGVGILGLGEANLRIIPLDRKFHMNMKMLEDALAECLARNELVLAVVGTYGTTEEGAIDDFDRLSEIRGSWHAGGTGEFWIHADACYGGYAASVSHPRGDAETISQFIGADGWSAADANRWLKVTSSLGQCDSIAIDPHKLGYIPYPAGAVLYRDYRVREFIRCDAPYLNVAPAETNSKAANHWSTPAAGKYTLEGSRPGASGAAVWLAHRTVPLDRSGHGLLIAQSIAGANRLQRILQREFSSRGQEGVGYASLYGRPDLNILCYTFPSRFDGRDVPLVVINRAIEEVYSEMLPTDQHPIQTQDFVIAKTSFGLDEYGEELRDVVGSLGISGNLLRGDELCESGNPWRDDSKINVVRTVVMGPFLTAAMTTSKQDHSTVDVATEFARSLRRALERRMTDILDRPIEESRRPALNSPVLVVEDEPGTREDLCAQLRSRSFRAAYPACVLGAGDVEAALEFLDAQSPLGLPVAAIVDLQLGDRLIGGIEFLNVALARPFFKGAVIFTDFASGKVEEVIKELSIRAPRKPVHMHRKPRRALGRFQAQLNRVMEDLWETLASPDIP